MLAVLFEVVLQFAILIISFLAHFEMLLMVTSVCHRAIDRMKNDSFKATTFVPKTTMLESVEKVPSYILSRMLYIVIL